MDPLAIVQSQLPLFRNPRSYVGEVVQSLIIPANPIKLTSTVTTGVIAHNHACDPVADVNSWAERMGDMFVEYRVIKIVAIIHNIASATGLTQFYWDEVNSTPDAAAASQRTGMTILANTLGNQAYKVTSFVPTDLDDLNYKQITSSQTVAYFKAYTNNTDYGTTTVATDLFSYRLHYYIQFKGLKAV
jgi:hypothetical protein